MISTHARQKNATTLSAAPHAVLHPANFHSGVLGSPPSRTLTHPATDPDAPCHPGDNPGANRKSISHICYPILVAFVWELTTETIHLPLGCLKRDSLPPAAQHFVDPASHRPFWVNHATKQVFYTAPPGWDLPTSTNEHSPNQPSSSSYQSRAPPEFSPTPSSPSAARGQQLPTAGGWMSRRSPPGVPSPSGASTGPSPTGAPPGPSHSAVSTGSAPHFMSGSTDPVDKAAAPRLLTPSTNERTELRFLGKDAAGTPGAVAPLSNIRS